MVSCLVLVVAHRVFIMGSFILARECSSYGSWASLLPGVWDLSSLTGGQTHVSCIARWIPNHWTTREVPVLFGQSWWGVYFLFPSCSSPVQIEKVLNAFSDGQLQSRNCSKFCSSRTGAVLLSLRKPCFPLQRPFAFPSCWVLCNKDWGKILSLLVSYCQSPGSHSLLLRNI